MNRNLFYLLFLCLGFVSCRKTDDEIIHREKKHTVIVYMLANNDLYSNAVKNIPQFDNVKLNEYYRTLAWCNESGFEAFFN
jgi:hypothetical protein